MPTLVDQGETWSSPTYEVRDTNGALVSGATVTATVTVDGTPTAATVANTGTGTYAIDYLTSVAGQHDVVVTATGGPLGAIVRKWTDTFVVVAPGGSVISTDDALTHLRAQKVITGSADTDQLRWLCLVATDAVGRDLGRAIVREVVTEKHSGGACALRLRRTPVRSVTSVVESGVTLSATDGVDWTLDDLPETGLLHRGSTTAGARWSSGRANITVTYVAGWQPLPHIVRKVALNAVERMWQSSQQASHPLVEDLAGDGAVFAAIGSLTAPEQAAFNSLRAAAI